MKLPEDIKNRIIEALKPIDPFRVILFGSYAWGEPGRDSDIDLYVITQDEFIPSSFREQNRIYLGVARNLYGIEREFPVDLIVHTKTMNRRFNELGGGFSKKIHKDGVILI
jgi:uncharacterized protein